MKDRISVFATLLLFAGSAALAATTHDNSNTLTVSINPPTGSIRCGFSVSGSIKSPKPDLLTYTFVWQSEYGIIGTLNRSKAEQMAPFKGPDTVRVTGQSKDFGNDETFRKHKLIRVQLRTWLPTAWLGVAQGAIPQQPSAAESEWVDVPVGSVCTTDKMSPALAPAPTTIDKPATTIRRPQ